MPYKLQFGTTFLLYDCCESPPPISTMAPPVSNQVFEQAIQCAFPSFKELNITCKHGPTNWTN
ncbi:Suppressor of forked protein (Suf) [Musa troglodytarum]|uniref:Suppressor of forked protein (Suf) n=1 Tax=Musa troglodytarum TaxID=320322 RepID=A0A9E7KYK2_9LILI|nr:Suppressor of forked protein (Suf) [Musa troglodytarum]